MQDNNEDTWAQNPPHTRAALTAQLFCCAPGGTASAYSADCHTDCHALHNWPRRRYPPVWNSYSFGMMRRLPGHLQSTLWAERLGG